MENHIVFGYCVWHALNPIFQNENECFSKELLMRLVDIQYNSLSHILTQPYRQSTRYVKWQTQDILFKQNVQTISIIQCIWNSTIDYTYHFFVLSLPLSLFLDFFNSSRLWFLSHSLNSCERALFFYLLANIESVLLFVCWMSLAENGLAYQADAKIFKFNKCTEKCHRTTHHTVKHLYWIRSLTIECSFFSIRFGLMSLKLCT